MADYVKLRTHVQGHVRFLEAGMAARDLYVWGMLWAGQQETDGIIPMAAVLASPWSHGGKRNVAVAQKLVDVGLWERIDEGYRIRKWSEQGNVTKAELIEKRKFDRERKSAQRAAKARGQKGATTSPPQPDATPPLSALCPSGTPPGIPTSTFNSGSGSGSLGGAGGAVPPWWSAAIATAEQAVGGTVDQPEARWLEYDGARERKGWARSQRDAVGWLTAVIRAERTRARAGPKGDAAVTRQPFDPEAPWMKLGDTGS